MAICIFEVFDVRSLLGNLTTSYKRLSGYSNKKIITPQLHDDLIRARDERRHFIRRTIPDGISVGTSYVFNFLILC